MAADLLQSPAAPRKAPSSPALSREQIKSRSSRGWSVSKDAASSNGNTASPSLGIPPLHFRSKPHPQPASAGMGRTASMESTASSTGMDVGSPFGNILGQFQPSPALDASVGSNGNARKTSGSYRILDKKAVSNSPFLTGGNTRSATGSNYLPASQQLGLTSPRKPFAPSSAWKQGETNSAPTSPARSGLHGLGVFSPHGQQQQSSTDAAKDSHRLPHRRSNSDVENLNPDFAAFASHQYDAGKKNNRLSVQQPGEHLLDLSPATRFNAEMESLGQPRAVDVTCKGSDSDSSASDSRATESMLPSLHNSYGQAAKPTAQEETALQSKRGPRPSVATLGHRATVSNSPFLSQNGPLSPPAGLASTLRMNGRDGLDHPVASGSAPLDFEHASTLSQPTSVLTSPRRGMLGPREPSITDLKARAEEQDFFNDFTDAYNSAQDDTALDGVTELTEHALLRKASKKSVKWAEMEEVCEFDVMTEEGESRRSSSTGSYHNNDYDDEEEHSYGEGDEETRAQVQEILRQHGVQDLRDMHAAVAAPGLNDDTYYDEEPHSTRHPHAGPHVEQDLQDSTPRHESRSTGLGRDFSLVSDQASVIDNGEDRSGSSFADEAGEGEIQQLISQVEAASMNGRTHHGLGDVFGSPLGTTEFGCRTPHSSAGAQSISSNVSSGLGTPQPLNRNGSLSRRPLPSPPVLSMSSDLATDAVSSPSRASVRSKGDSTDRNSFILQTASADDSQFSLPDLGFGGSDMLSEFRDLGLARKESLKRSPGVNCRNGTAVAIKDSIKEESQKDLDSQEELLPAASIPERSSSPKPSFLTAEDVRNSLRRKPSAIAHVENMPMSSTPPPGPSAASKAALPPFPLREQSLQSTPTSIAKTGPSTGRAISARPAPPPMRVSSEELPALRSSTPIASPTRELESALDRLVREAAAGNVEAVQALKGDWAQAYSASSAGKDAQSQRDEAIRAAKQAKKGLSASAGPSRRHRRSLSAGDTTLDLSEEYEDDDEELRTSTPQKKVMGSGETVRARTAPSSSSGPARMPLALNTAKKADNAFGKQLDQALDSVVEHSDKKYRIKEQSRGVLEYSGSAVQKISTVGNAGDIDAGGAWRKVRRPSDMNEHRSQIREYKQASASKSRKAGALFVKIGRLKLCRDLPVPQEPTYIACELFNGLDHVITGVSRLQPDTEVMQEFELIAHPNLEVTLAFKVRKDPTKDRHLFPRPQSTVPASPSKRSHSGSASGGFRTGLRNLLSSPKKARARPGSAMDLRASSPIPPSPGHPLLDYLAQDGELCRVSFKAESLIPECTGKRIKTIHKCTLSGRSRRLHGNTIDVDIQLFYLPPLPGVPVDKLPQSIEDCVDGLAKAEWHERNLFEGILTQMGADCATWRRRYFKLQGSQLTAYNEVTHKPYTIFDLSHAAKLDDPEEDMPSTPANTLNTPATISTSRSGASRESQHQRTLSVEDEDDPFSTRPNSFRIYFKDGTFIDLCADPDRPQDKLKWLVFLKPIIRGEKKVKGLGVVPPLWAQTLREMNRDLAKATKADRPALPSKTAR